MMEKKLTKTEYYEDITSLLIQSNLMGPSEVPNKNLYNKKIDYLNSLSRVIKKKYDIILNMESNDIKKYKLENKLEKHDILNFLNNELELEISEIFYENLSNNEENRKIMRRLLSVLEIGTPLSISDIIKGNEYYFEDVLTPKISALLKILINNGLVECISIKKVTKFVKTKKLDYIFKILRGNYNNISNDIEQFVMLKQEETKLPDEISSQDNVKNNKQNLIKYIQGILTIETDIISLKKRYNILKRNLISNLIENSEEYFMIENELLNKKEILLKDIVKLEMKIKKEPELIFSIILEKPKKPSKPTFNVVEPKVPTYLKPNIFNKKKIAKENEILKYNYELDLKHYEKKLKEYNEKIEKYKEDIIKYKEEILKCEEEDLRLNKEKYLEELEKYNIEKEKLLINLNQKNEELQCLNKDYNQEKETILSKNLKYNEVQAIIYEMNYITSIIEKNIKLKNDLYSKGIIYIKYRDYVSLARFCDYLLSGRCSELEGADGAYNIYEQEIRTDNIIDKLDRIELSLEEIKDNQIHIYNELVKINHSLDLINGQLFVTNILHAVQIEQLDKVIQSTNQIAYNTKVIAYYAEKTANYQKNLLLLTLFNK